MHFHKAEREQLRLFIHSVFIGVVMKFQQRSYNLFWIDIHYSDRTHLWECMQTLAQMYCNSLFLIILGITLSVWQGLAQIQFASLLRSLLCRSSCSAQWGSGTRDNTDWIRFPSDSVVWEINKQCKLYSLFSPTYLKQGDILMQGRSPVCWLCSW